MILESFVHNHLIDSLDELENKWSYTIKVDRK